MRNKLQEYYDNSKKFEADATACVSVDYDMDMISIPKYAIKQEIDVTQLRRLLTGKTEIEVNDIMKNMIEQKLITTYHWVESFVGKRNMMSPAGFEGWVTVCFSKKG